MEEIKCPNCGEPLSLYVITNNYFGSHREQYFYCDKCETYFCEDALRIKRLEIKDDEY